MNLMEYRNKRVVLISFILILAVPFSANASTTDQGQKSQRTELQELQIQYDKLKRQINNNKNAAKKSLRKMQKKRETLQFRGFFSAGVATTDGKAELRLLQENQEIGDEPNFQSDSIVGLQLDAIINDRTRYTHQMITSGYDINHTVKTEWAYFSYHLGKDTSVKLGRLRIPFFLLSESLEVGFTYPWVRPQPEIYTISISGYEGVDLGHKFTLGNGYGRVSLFYGSGLSSLAGLLNIDYKATDLKGFSLDYNLDHWFFRASYVVTDFSLSSNISCDEGSVQTALIASVSGGAFDQSAIECGGLEILTISFNIIDELMIAAGDSSDLLIGPLLASDASFSYLNFALRYDDGVSLIIAEYGESEANKFLNPLGPAGYILYGYRLGRWMPFVSIGNLVTSRDTKKLRGAPRCDPAARRG